MFDSRGTEGTYVRTEGKYVLILKFFWTAKTKSFEPKQAEAALGPKTLTAHYAGIYCIAEINNHWNKFLVAIPSDTTLKLFGKTVVSDRLAKTEKRLKEKYP